MRLLTWLCRDFVKAAGCFLLSGCAAALPTYEWAGHEAAMARIIERSERVQTVAGSCRIHLRDKQGAGGSLDGALIAMNPGHLRLRAWKFGHAAIYTTSTPDGVWVLRGVAGDETGSLCDLTAREIARAWSLLSGEFFATAAPTSTTGLRHHIASTGYEDIIRCEIDRRTLLPLRFDSVDSSGTVRASLLLQDHRLVGGRVWPMRLVFESAAGTVVIQMRDVEINEAHPPGAFRPPNRAERLP